jgi:hypothetical protein
VLKNFPFTDTVHTIYGKEVHKSAEEYVLNGTPMPPEHAFMQPLVDALIKKNGRKLPEHEMGVTVDLRPCDFKSEDVWVRGIADLLIIDDDDLKAWVFDYKTGNNKYPDRDQLILMSLMVFVHFPHVRQVNSGLLFVVKDSTVCFVAKLKSIGITTVSVLHVLSSLTPPTSGTLHKPRFVGGVLYAVVSSTRNISLGHLFLSESLCPTSTNPVRTNTSTKRTMERKQ